MEGKMKNKKVDIKFSWKNILKYLKQAGFIYLAFLSSYYLAVFLSVLILNKKLEVDILGYFIFSFYEGIFLVIPILIAFNLLVNNKYLNKFGNNLKFLFATSFIMNFMYYIFFNFHLKLTPISIRNNVLGFLFGLVVPIVEYIAIMFVVAFLINYFSRLKIK